MELKYCPQCGGALAAVEIDGFQRMACPDPECGYTFWFNPTPVVAGLVEYEGDVLLIQNKDWPPGWWGLLTGFLEKDETPGQGMLRELREELGLEGEIAGLIGLYSFFRMNQIIAAFHVRAWGPITVGDELNGYKAVPIDKLRPWKGATGKATADWLAARRGEKGLGNWE